MQIISVLIDLAINKAKNSRHFLYTYKAAKTFVLPFTPGLKTSVQVPKFNEKFWKRLYFRDSAFKLGLTYKTSGHWMRIESWGEFRLNTFGPLKVSPNSEVGGWLHPRPKFENPVSKQLYEGKKMVGVELKRSSIHLPILQNSFLQSCWSLSNVLLGEGGHSQTHSGNF